MIIETAGLFHNAPTPVRPAAERWSPWLSQEEARVQPRSMRQDPPGRDRQKSLRIFLPLAARSRYHCAWKMAYFSTEPAPAPCNLNGKNRVWDFFRFSNETHPANRRQPAQPRRKIRPTATKAASGIPCWPSRDPIGEKGGVNLYCFIQNDGVVRWDFEGLYNTAQEALNAAKDAVGQKTFSSRLHGVSEFWSVSLPIIFPRYIYGSNFVLYAVEPINGVGILYRGAVGVEYGTYVYCDKADGRFYYAEPIRGTLPTRDELLIMKKYGGVNIPVTTGDDNPKITALVHTHTISEIAMFSNLTRPGGPPPHNGLLDEDGDSVSLSVGPPLNNGPSNEDSETASFAGVRNYIVFEGDPGVYYFGSVAKP